MKPPTFAHSSLITLAQVILYNLFEDYGRLWQVACDTILNKSEKYDGPELPPIICHEVRPTLRQRLGVLTSNIYNQLKHLYVAVTRARNRIWIVDASIQDDNTTSILVSHVHLELSAH